ncbi:MAG: glycosyltransferase family 4 protein, partial [bacterium]|nr:glycosyltransferase family 4 protein [bacterium]
MSRDRKLRIVLMHDWLTGMRGGEHCLEVLCRAFAAHEIEIVTAFFCAERIPTDISRYITVVSWANYLPGVRRYYRFLLPVYPLIALELSLRL